MRRRLVSLFAAGPLIARRRALRDFPFIVVWTALVVLAVVASVAAPRLVDDTIDSGAREAVAAVGDQADLLAVTRVGASRSDRAITTPPDEVQNVADQLQKYLPPGIESTYASTSYGVMGPHATVDFASPIADDMRLDVAIGMLIDATAVTVVDGELPGDVPPPQDAPAPVAISSAAATAAGLSIGSIIAIPVDDGGLTDDVTLVVAAIVDAVDPADPIWRDLPGLFTAPVREQHEGPLVTVVPLATPAVIQRVTATFPEPFTGRIRFHLDPEKFTGDLVAQVSEEQRKLGVNSISMTGPVPYPVSLTTTFTDALAPFAGQVRAAVAQFSMIIAGLLGVVASVLLLMSRLLVLRRAPEFALERARGSSVAATVLRTVPQSVIVVAVAVGVELLVLGPPDYLPFFIAIVAIALLADPIQSLIAVRATRTARRMPANRQDRAAITARRHARRIALEVTVIALGVGALAALLARGLLQTTTDGIDPLLAATPVLVAAMVTVVLVRIYPVPVRAAATLAARSPGMHGLIGSVRARRAIAVLPLLALTLAVGLTTTNAFLGATVEQGQLDASWERVGADARINTPIADEQKQALESAPGVDAVASLASLQSSRVDYGSGIGFATALVVDDGFATVLDGLPNAVSTDPLDVLFEPSDEIPVVVDSIIAKRAATDTLILSVGQRNITLRIAGTFDAPVTGYLRGPFIYLPLDRLNEELGTLPGDAVVADTTLVLGPGTDAALATSDIDATKTISRVTWLSDQRALALVLGVQSALAISTLLVAALAVIALLATTVAGSRDRTRTLSLLRTLGTPSRFGWWLALSDLAPLVAAALIGGLGAGVLIAELLFGTLGLTSLTGGLVGPVVGVDVTSVVLIVLGTAVLLAVAILAEVLMSRRKRLNDVLRVGETV